MSSSSPMPTILCILDGWGLAPDSQVNGISNAYTPTWDHFMQDYPHAQLQASELYVGLPAGQMGNSEVGHMTIGAGRVILQDLPRIDLSLEGEKNEITQDEKLTSNPKFINFIEKLKNTGGACHLIGLMSPGGVHSHQSHIEAIIRLLQKENIHLHVHAVLDGRDTPPQSAYSYLQKFLENTNQPLASIGGRYYMMDRDKRWDRIEKAYQMVVHAQAPRIDDPLIFLKEQYKHGIGDEFMIPHCVGNYSGIKEGDGLFIANFRADRVRQILSALLIPSFNDFDRGPLIPFAATLGLGEYAADLTPFIPALFPKEQSTNPLGAIVSAARLKQLRIAETEKYAHVTFFLNGGREEVFPGEDRILVPSPDVATYDLKPEMSAVEVTDKVVETLLSSPCPYSLIVINYANTDMVGHTGIQEAILKAVETIDHCLGRLEKAATEAGFALVITADHGNVEQMIDETTGLVHTAHTCNPVPIVLVNGPKYVTGLNNGQLSDVTPTILELMGLSKPLDMTGKSLLKRTVAHAVA
ncbi:MAG: 2,3-bisphosphoglycerate-independent phosphoglycerate mutase [Alphaproteobacteria bacterium]|nr:2,3-bisphosphoglycerate-independent phosphoglycerate mutase [Alphaproteobacteria bacterium]